jgi:hypothetical protein
MIDQKITTSDWIKERFGEKPNFSDYRKLVCKCEVPSAHGIFVIGNAKKCEVRCLECGGLYDVISRPPKQLPNSHETTVAILAICQLDDMAYNEICHCGKPRYPVDGKYSIDEKIFCENCGQVLGKISITH